MPSGQMILDLGHRSAFGRSDFLVSGCNAEAAAWIDRWPDWPSPLRGLAIFGPPECGKTHLGAVWRRASGAVAVEAAALTVDGLPETLGDARHAGDQQVVADDEAMQLPVDVEAEARARQVAEDRVDSASDDDGADGEAVEAVGEVDGVGCPHHQEGEG